MADEKSQEKVVATSGEEAKKTDSGDNNKTEGAAPDAGSTTAQARPRGQLPTHYKGMPKQWEKNRVPKKDDKDDKGSA
ncbi:hypothetical protein F4776DRAFT_324764 [Hypoxylon sp. NC0597]|nr:hypothetical protein F4776DRAFT_324764 [Hypoxylon sp. NC0597]